jgi:hypothetical protein
VFVFFEGKHHFFWLAITTVVFKGETSCFGVCFLKKRRNSNKYAVSRWGFDQETWNVMVSCRICGENEGPLSSFCFCGGF